MVTTNGHRQQLDSLQVLRAIAAVLVVIHHSSIDHLLYFTNPSVWRPAFGGWVGVDIFFVLSGYLIYRIHEKDLGQPSRLGRYAWRRFSRIFPPMWVAASLILGLLVLRQVKAGGLSSIWDHPETNPIKILLNLVLWPQDHRPYPVTWTLTYELWFYIVIGSLFFVKATIARRILLAYAAVVAILWLINFKADGWAGVTLSRYVLEFLAGVGVAELARRGKPVSLQIAGILAVGGLGFVFHRPQESVGLVAVAGAVGATGLLAFAVRLEEVRNLKVPKWVLWLGGASYSIYLIHNIAISITNLFMTRWFPRHSAELPVPLQVFPVLAGLLAGSVFHMLIERPLLKRLQKVKVG